MFIFPYITKGIAGENLVAPELHLEVKTLLGIKNIPFLLDSGADITSLPLEPYAKLLGVKPQKNQKVTIDGVEGKGVGAFPAQIAAKLGNRNFSLRSYLLESNIDPLLGRLDFWDLFSINFDNFKKQTVIVPLI
jgi:hypothetical protein